VAACILRALPMVGRKLSHYEVLAELGEGGMGVVYKARDTRLDRFVAIKVLTAATISEERRRRFAQEARAASALNHPGVVTIHDIATEEGVDFIAMEKQFVRFRSPEASRGRFCRCQRVKARFRTLSTPRTASSWPTASAHFDVTSTS